MKRLLPTVLGIACLVVSAPAARAAEPDPAGIAFFEAKIRPVLVEQCISCHGAEKQRGNLRLDSKEAVLKGGDTGPALVPGKAKDSLLVQALHHKELKMPPKKKLPDAAIADFVKWVDMGAPDPRDGKPVLTKEIDWAAARQFWAFQPPRKGDLPKVQNAAWPKNGIDNYVLARLEAEKLRPVATADKRALIRRATFDLIGLPPTPEEVDAFVKDETPQAFETVIDRLLQSPHYGERWGRHWLDVARYAEDQAHTFAVTPNTSAWRYRDWVVSAFNQDMPYDRFIKLQLAADLIETDESERLKQLPALGFIGLGAQYYKNTDAARAIADELDDRVDTVTRGFLGLTVSCARCHDHKFDPIPTQDYYSLAGVFFSTKLANLPLATGEEIAKYQEGRKLVDALTKEVNQFVAVERDGLRQEHAGEIARYMQATWTYQARKRDNAKWSVGEQAKQDKLHVATLDRWVKYLEGNPKLKALDGWRQLPRGGTGAAATEEDVATAAQAFQKHVQEILAEKMPPADKDKTAVMTALFGDKGLFAPSEDELKAKLPPEKRERLVEMRRKLMEMEKESPAKLDAKFPIAHALSESNPIEMKVYVRGNPAKLGEPAPRRFPRILAGDAPTPFGTGSGRRELADAIASRDNPLTARVMVNRLWMNHFGRGLVGTPSNFGQLGERPTHPELLDYLASRFVESNWSIKAMHREIMLSATYQLSTASDDKNAEVDADNRLLWRMNRRRLDIESWRDSLLAVSGKLDRTIGGATFDLNGGNARRTVYAKVSRHELNGLLRLFDFPDANISSEKRTETTVPQQQLFVLNSPFVVDQAKALAARAQADTKDEGERVQRLFQLAYGRPAGDAELQLATRFLAAADPAEEPGKNKLTRWERFAQVLLGGNEFLYLD